MTSEVPAKWHDTNPIEELFYSQKEIARFLELGYLALRDHPEVAAEVITNFLFNNFII